MLLYTEEGGDQTVKMPGLTGRTMTEVNTIASSMGLNVQLTGLVVGSGGTAVSHTQSIAAGTVVPKGTVVKVGFLYTDTNDSTGQG